MALVIRLLGQVGVVRDGVEVALPRSRKVRLLLAFLALEGAPLSRSRLCDLFWDVPNDPRAELRWCLSKLRSVLDDEDRRRVVTADAERIALDLDDVVVDALELERLGRDGIASAATERLAGVAALVRGDLLEGMQVDGPELTGWLSSRRHRHRTLHAAVLEELTTRAPARSDVRRERCEAWLRAAPFELRAHEAMIGILLESGRLRDAEAHVERTIRAFEHEGLDDWGALREAIHAARRGASAPPRIEVVASPPPETAFRAARRGSVMVMPFAGATPACTQMANGLTDDVITRLAKLRVLFVIARGTSYALRDRGMHPQEAGRIANVEYVVTGSVKRGGTRMSVLVELAETRDSGILWTDEIDADVGATFDVLDTIVDRVVSAIAEEIERAECRRAVMKTPSSLDAWEAHHRGLWHMYRFNGPDNELAARFFREALRLDPTFARAHAGLSFTHFQNVFLGLTPDRDRQMALTLETAGQSVAADDRDPAAHWALGRALWLSGEQKDAIGELERSVDLSPNFALGHYTLGFVHAQSGDPRTAIEATAHSTELSPFDPLKFGMLASRALAHMRIGERDEAADWAVKAARQPNAHAHILAIAAANLALADRREQATDLVGRIRAKLPSYTVEDFLRAFRFDEEAEALVRHGAKRIGFD